MKRLTKYMVVVIVLFSVVVLMTGCCIDDKVTGGGWFMGTVNCEETKCTFGFNAHGEGCLCDDHVGNKLHCSVVDLYQVGPNTYKFEGVDKKGAGDIVVTVVDLGQPGPDPGDEIRVECDSMVWEGYLEGGNIVIH